MKELQAQLEKLREENSKLKKDSKARTQTASNQNKAEESKAEAANKLLTEKDKQIDELEALFKEAERKIS